jgi:tetratricopeptide (TPR) repeat protein
MIHKNIKLVLSGASLGYGIYQFIEGNIGNGIFFTLLTALILFFYFRNELILWSFLKMRKQDLEGTEKILNKIKYPSRALIQKQQGYYHYLFGIIYAQKNLGTSEKHFKQAIKLGLSMDHDLAMAKMSLAGIAMQKRRKREAQTLLTEAKKLDKNQMLGDQLKLMQQQLKKI